MIQLTMKLTRHSASGLGETKSRKYIVIYSNQTLSTETRLIDAAKPDALPVVFEPRSANHEYQIDHLGKDFYHQDKY